MHLFAQELFNHIKRTDSRLGVGFRLGEHADFQIMVELGPQTETRPIGGGSATNKRNVAPNSYRIKDSISNTDGGKWLSNWSQQMKKAQNSIYIDEDVVPNLTSPDKPYLPVDTMSQLGELYDATNQPTKRDKKPINVKLPTVGAQVLSEAQKEKKKKEVFEELSDVELE
ncbi:uncharacterized protein LOC113375127 [Ctenocephalides felis]|uniref:uncharacterized protein LOC113375127 n=1 Tax=Ctenocephalides felis TaxID=7515 RepID=UPI000E6E52A0|nr:uncharacterized protein LOC113375127 [Ctenocephalides felis]